MLIHTSIYENPCMSSDLRIGHTRKNFLSVTMATTTVLSLLPILLLAVSCRAISLDPDVSAAALTETQGPALNLPKVTLLVTYHRNQTGHLVAQVQLEHGNDQVQINSAQNATAPNSRALVGYSAAGVRRYSIYTTGKNWDEARRICDQEGGYLAIINSEAEYRVLHDLYELVPITNDVESNSWAFIGLHDRFVEGEFLTIQGKPLESTGFTRWDYPEPNNIGGNENCGSLSRHGSMNDIHCSWKLAFFCEQES